MSDITWMRVNEQNLAIAARDAGFDLTMYAEYPKSVQDELRKSAIKHVIWNLEEDYERAHNTELKKLKRGVYVIRISNPFTVRYGGGCSNIIYIGRGDIIVRLKAHYKTTIFDFMQSLNGANFDFWICEPRRKNRADYYKQVEHDLLEKFAEKLGDGEYPLLNKNKGTNIGVPCGTGWDRPFSGQGMRPQWVLEPTKHWEFTKL